MEDDSDGSEEEEEEEEEVTFNPNTERGNCWTCGADNPHNLCNRCKVTKYCDEACQSRNWPIHKGRCTMLSAQYAAADRVKARLKKYRALAEGTPQEELEGDLCSASLLGRIVDIERIIAAGAQVNQRGPQHYSPLYCAAQEGHARAIGVLVRHGAQVNTRQERKFEWNRAALHAAAQNGQGKAVAALLGHGAQIDVADYDGKSPLYLASQENRLEVVLMLLKHGAQVDQTEGGRSGFSARSIARKVALYEAGGLSTQDVGRNKKMDESRFIHIFALRPDLAMPFFEAEIEDQKFELPEGESGCTPLFISAQQGHAAVARLLLEHGAQVDSRGNGGASPLYMASQNNHTNVVALLLEKGAQDDLSTNVGTTPLCISSEKGHASVVALLLEHGAPIDSIDKEGVSALYIASQNNHPEVVALLLHKSAQVDLPSNWAVTPLCISAQEGHAACVRLLLQAGADPLRRAENGNTPLDAATRNNHAEVVALLQARIAAGPPE